MKKLENTGISTSVISYRPQANTCDYIKDTKRINENDSRIIEKTGEISKSLLMMENQTTSSDSDILESTRLTFI